MTTIHTKKAPDAGQGVEGTNPDPTKEHESMAIEAPAACSARPSAHDELEAYLAPHRAHKPWCDLTACHIASDTVAHYGPAAPIVQGGDQDPLGDLWRNPHGENYARPAHFGVPVVELQVDSNAGFYGMSWFTPAEARALALQILEAADVADGQSHDGLSAVSAWLDTVRTGVPQAAR